MARGERFRPALGDHVRVSTADPDEFRRVPAYLHGVVGEVVGECGDKPLPVGFGQGEVFLDPEPVLTVRFEGDRIFGDTARGTWVHADLWVSNLEPVAGGQA